MSNQNIFVIGTSAGGVDALCTLLNALPKDLNASIFIVLHIPANAPSLLDIVLTRCGSLPVTTAKNGEKIQPKQIYIAPPNKHLLITSDHITLTNTPKINHVRPAIDPLFESAAISHGPNVVGVLLTGTLNDGTYGLATIKRAKGIAIVQDPAEALYADMPENALKEVKVDYCLPIKEMSSLLAKLASKKNRIKSYKLSKAAINNQLIKNGLIIKKDKKLAKIGKLSAFTCPDCHGTLWELNDKQLVKFRCRIGHTYNLENLLTTHTESLENNLWEAVRALEENATLSYRVAERMGKKHPLSSKLFKQKGRAAEENAKRLKSILLTDKTKVSNKKNV